MPIERGCYILELRLEGNIVEGLEHVMANLRSATSRERLQQWHCEDVASEFPIKLMSLRRLHGKF